MKENKILIMNNNINKKLKWNIILPVLLLLLGISLLVYMIIYEDEPGAIPLVLIASGLVLLVMNWRKSKKDL